MDIVVLLVIRAILVLDQVDTHGYSGNFGGNSQPFKFSTATTAPPGTGLVTFNNATYSSVSSIYLDNTNADGIDMSLWHGNPFYPAIITFYAQGDPTTYVTYNVTLTIGNGYTTLTVTYISGNGTFSNNQRIIVSYVRSGASGYSGYSGRSGYSGYSSISGYSRI